MIKNKKIWFGLVSIIFIVIVSYLTITRLNINLTKRVGDIVDTFNGVNIYYNGGVDNVEERNLTADGYNLGLKYQCVEFVKRYYYERFQHKMPDSYGHARSFFNTSVPSQTINPQRGLLQFSNGTVKPAVDDIIVFNSGRYGHVAIISEVNQNSIEIVQQNPGPFMRSRKTIALKQSDGSWIIDKKNVLGFLRRP